MATIKEWITEIDKLTTADLKQVAAGFEMLEVFKMIEEEFGLREIERLVNHTLTERFYDELRKETQNLG